MFKELIRSNMPTNELNRGIQVRKTTEITWMKACERQQLFRVVPELLMPCQPNEKYQCVSASCRPDMRSKPNEWTLPCVATDRSGKTHSNHVTPLTKHNARVINTSLNELTKLLGEFVNPDPAPTMKRHSAISQ